MTEQTEQALQLWGWTSEGVAKPVRAVFTSRFGGRSTGPYAELNLGDHVGDELGTVLANRAILAAAVGLDPVDVVSARQVHGTDVLDVDGHMGPEEGGWHTLDVDADALLTETGKPVAVLVADCAPVVVAGDNGHVVIHGGWRGVADGILERAVAGLDGDLHAVVGPMIGVCCYVVGPEVAARFSHAHLTGDSDDGNLHLDLRAAVAQRLTDAGVARVDHVDVCTRCDERLFSHRRSGEPTGRQGVLAWGE